MREIKKIDPISFANIEAIIMAIVGFVVGLLYSAGLTMSGNMLMINPAIAIIGLPILYAITGWISTAIFCVIYNLLASGIGGVKIELK